MTIPSPARTFLLAATIALGTSACMSGINREIDDSITQARLELHSEPLTLHAKGRPDAIITPQGKLAIAGKIVPTNPAQSIAVQKYRTAMIAYGDAALDLSAKEAGPLARRSVARALWGTLTGTSDRAGRLIDEDSTRFEEQVQHLCPQLEKAWSAQQSLSAALPGFKPYADLAQKENDQCIG